MSKIKGYFLILNKERTENFVHRDYEDFAEPVKLFIHSKKTPLVCFVFDNKKKLMALGVGKKGVKAGTGLRRLNIVNIYTFSQAIKASRIIDSTARRVHKFLNDKLKSGGILGDESMRKFLVSLVKIDPGIPGILQKLIKDRDLLTSGLKKTSKQSLAEQKEAILTAMNLANIDRSIIGEWNDDDITDSSHSFIDGLPQAVLREDSMVVNDLNNFPGYQQILASKYSSSRFRNRNSHLTIILANRLPLEELTGTDLIYLNEDYNNFIMIQYKVMEKEVSDFVFRLPSQQLEEEIRRMDAIKNEIGHTKPSRNVNDYRLSQDPFYIKICPRIEFQPNQIGLCSGMYLPLEYFKHLKQDDCTKGERGGRKITFKNVKRYFNNTEFAATMSNGWIGTSSNQSELLKAMIKDVLENGKSAVIAINKSEMGRRQTISDVLFSSDNETDF